MNTKQSILCAALVVASVATLAQGGPTDLKLTAAQTNVVLTENIAANLTLSVRNQGPVTASNVQLVVNLPAGLIAIAATNSAGTSQVTTSNVTCAVASLASNISFTVTLTLRASFLPLTSPVAVNLSNLTATVNRAAGDPNPADNSLLLPVSVRAQTDWGDALGGFPVTAAENGAYHRYSPTAPWLGTRWDNDGNGNHSPLSDFDDTHEANDDEDGIAFQAPLMPGTTATVVVTVANAAGRLDAWADFNSNTNWADAGEQIFTDQPVAVGSNALTFTVPANAAIGTISTRWRISTTGGLSYTGYGGVGEVEDHVARVVRAPTIVFNGITHEALGAAEGSVVSNRLAVSTVNGAGGMRVRLGESDGWATVFDGLNQVEAANSSVEFAGHGTVGNSTNDELLARLRIDGSGSNAQVSVDFSGMGATSYRVYVSDGDGHLLFAPPATASNAIPVLLLPGDCPGGFLEIETVRLVDGHIVLSTGCVKLLIWDLIEGSRLLQSLEHATIEIIPNVVVQPPLGWHYLDMVVSPRTGPVLLNDAVYKRDALWSASGPFALEVATNTISAFPMNSDGTGGLVMHSDVSDLGSPGQIPWQSDDQILHYATLPLAPVSRIINSIFRSRVVGLDRVTGQLFALSATLANVNANALQVATDFSGLGAAQVNVSVFNSSNLVGRVTLPNGTLGTLAGTASVNGIATAKSGPHGFAIRFNGPMTFAPANGASLTGTEIHLTASNANTRTNHDLLKSLSVENQSATLTAVPPPSANEVGNPGTVGSLGDLDPSVSWGFWVSGWYERGDAPAANRSGDARHGEDGNMRLGVYRDQEYWRTVGDNADWDDTHLFTDYPGWLGPDDEDGVTPVDWSGTAHYWWNGETANLQVVLGGSGYGFVAIWVDWDGDEKFEPEECIWPGITDSISAELAPATKTYSLTVPWLEIPGNDASTTRIVRVRVSDEPLTADDGHTYRDTGEVEDHLVTIYAPVDKSRFELGTVVTRVGAATLILDGNVLVLGSLGSSGDDGLRIALPANTDEYLMGFSRPTTTAQDSMIRFVALGQIAGQPANPAALGQVRLDLGPQAVILSSDFSMPGAGGALVETYLNGAKVGATLSANNGTVGGLPAGSEVVEFSVVAYPTLTYTLRLARPATFTPVLGGARTVDEIRFTPNVSVNGLVTLSSIVLTGANIDSLRIHRSEPLAIHPRLRLATIAGSLQLIWNSVPGKMYEVLRADRANAAPAEWVRLAVVPSLSDTNETSYRINFVPPPKAMQFYRLRVVGPTSVIPTTGQTNFYGNNNPFLSAPASGQPFDGQDAKYLRPPMSYVDNGDGTISDLTTGLMWQKSLSGPMSWTNAMNGAATFHLGGYPDWRLPSIKELYSLFSAQGAFGTTNSDSIPFINTNYFEFFYLTGAGLRFFDVQVQSSTKYVGTTMGGDETVFGVNFADGRIKGYPVLDPMTHAPATYYVRYVRGNADYGKNQFVDNGDGTVSDLATGLMWQKADSGTTNNWQQALAYAENLTLANHSDWRLPTAKELQSIVDYTRAPLVTGTAAIDTNYFQVTTDESFYWTSTTLVDGPPGTNYGKAVYLCFGQAFGSVEKPPGSGHWQLFDVHGAGAQRADFKSGNPADPKYAHGNGPQGDQVRIYNYVRAVRGGLR